MISFAYFLYVIALKMLFTKQINNIFSGFNAGPWEGGAWKFEFPPKEDFKLIYFIPYVNIKMCSSNPVTLS